jgi:tetratricopeptide (TPR) repeat protein
VALKVEPPRPTSDAFLGDELLSLALSRPREAEAAATSLLARDPSPLAASYAWQALSVAHRQLGDGRESLRCARRGLRFAQRAGDPSRVSDILATLGATLALVGRTREALETLDEALAHTHGVDAARIRVRHAGVSYVLGRFDDCLRHVNAALPVLRAAGDDVYVARSYNWRAMAHQSLGDWPRADRDLATAEEQFARLGQDLESAMCRHNRGVSAYQSGDVPAALRHFDAAEAMYGELGEKDPELELDRCRTLLSAGMAEVARDHAERAADLLVGQSARAHLRAEAFLTAASAALVAGDNASARTAAVNALALFRQQRRSRWVLRSRRIALLAQWLDGERSVAMYRAAVSVADELESLKDAESPEARLMAGRIASALRRRKEAVAHFERAGAARSRGAAITRATGWLAKALQADLLGDTRGMFAACRRGLDLLDQHRLTLGATEMRARATVHGVELAGLATRYAAAAADPQKLLVWSERWRATAIDAAPVRPPDDAVLARELATLRDLTTRISHARAEGTGTTTLEHEQRRIETAVRQRLLRTSGSNEGRTSELRVARLRAELGDTTLVELVEVDEVLRVVIVDRRRTVMHTVGPTQKALSELEFALFGLRRIAAATSPALVRASDRSLHAAAGALQQSLLGAAATGLGDGPVLVVPSGRLHAVPWSLLPALCGREVSVAPSATSWLRARSMRPPRQDQVTLVVGPGLVTGGAEVEKVAHLYPRATLLPETAATADDVLDALNGASLAHIAAHGTFRADNALFSSLRMADGPLTVHDLERLRRPPHRLVLSSCDSGLGEVAGADELLGLSSALIGMGCAGLLASVVQVNDPATVPLMVAVHEQLREGATLAQALYRARISLGDDDPVLAATGQSFVALGAA